MLSHVACVPVFFSPIHVICMLHTCMYVGILYYLVYWLQDALTRQSRMYSSIAWSPKCALCRQKWTIMRAQSTKPVFQQQQTPLPSADELPQTMLWYSLHSCIHDLCSPTRAALSSVPPVKCAYIKQQVHQQCMQSKACTELS